MRNKQHNLSVPIDNIFFLAYGIWFLGEILFKTQLNSIAGIDCAIIEKVINVIVLLIVIIYLSISSKYYFDFFLFLIISSTFVMYIAIRCGEFSYLCLFLFIIASQRIRFYDIVKVSFTILFCGIPSVMALCYCGIIGDFIFYRGGLARHSLGFSHPNTLGERIFELAVCWWYLRWKKIGLIDYIILIIMTYFTYKVTYSQTAVICMTCLGALSFIGKILDMSFPTIKRIMLRMLFLISLIFPCVSIWFCIVGLNLSWTKSLDKILSMRFSFSHKVYLLYGCSLWGKKIYVSGGSGDLNGLSERLWLDNSYANLLLRTGVFFMILFILMYWKTFWKFNDNIYISIVLFLFSLYGVMEQNMVQLSFNIFLLLASWVIYPQKDENEFNVKKIYDI